ncbi:auxin efflux carrier [Echria macrotheca]|uniref:Auxin efflux carrier n=1 Tax=Echria macrotheca TaxID=438768 RepID=A0AAJ0BKS9_9PEZI|nr:auxin efflux carrier [Echria macrotheca]
MAPAGLAESLIAAVQASLSVLLVIFYGGIAGWMGLLDHSSTKAISKIAVRMFLPALLVTKIGSELHSGSAIRYLIVFIWAILCHLVSFLIGVLAHYGLDMPEWVTVAIMFNNTTSYPLLLVTTLGETGILQALTVADETTSQAIERMKSYFLVFATVSSCLTFAVGPRLIDSEHGPDPEQKEDDIMGENPSIPADINATEETGLLGSRSGPVQFTHPFAPNNTFFPSKRRSSVFLRGSLSDRRASYVPKTRWQKLGPRTKWWLLFIADFFNAPLLGAIIGAILGLVPPLHRAFFNSPEHGGIFTAWLTASWKTIGSLFVPLPIVVAGVSLYRSMKDAKTNANSARLPYWPLGFILMIRFVLWPVASISLIYLLVTRTTMLEPDPMLWFAMMLMPTGPTAMKVITLIQVSDAPPEDEITIAKLLTVSYAISPILSFTVVGSLMASQAAI